MGEVSVYRLYDGNRILLYVGVTARGTVRQSEHADSKEWWPRVVGQEFVHYPTREAALAAESDAILKERPVFNRAGAVGWEQRRALYWLGVVDVLHMAQKEAKRRRQLRAAAAEKRGWDDTHRVWVPDEVLAEALDEGVVTIDGVIADKLERWAGRAIPVEEVIAALRREDRKAIPASLRRALHVRLREGAAGEWLAERMAAAGVESLHAIGGSFGGSFGGSSGNRQG